MYASYIARNTDRLYDVTWEGLGYRRTTKDGANGIVVFSKHGAVGAFFDPNVKPPASSKKKSALADHTKGIPAQLAGIARRDAFPAMTLDSDDPTVTAVFWSSPKGELIGARPWSQLESDGVYLVAPEMLEPEACIRELSKTYAFDDARLAAVLDTFATKAALAEPANARITLGGDARAALGLLPNTATRELLTGAGIDLA